MKLGYSWFAAVFSATAVFLQSVHANSQAPLPIRYTSDLEDVVIHTPSHRVHSHSKFDVTFSLHNGVQRVKLKLEPNHDVLPEDAQIGYLNPDGSISDSEPIDRREHRVFKGSSWTEVEPGHWTHAGWARVYVKQDGPQPMFEGAFSIMHDYHNIKLRSNYMRTWRPSDHLPEERDEDYMVVFRNSDMGAVEHTELKRRSVADASCQSDKLDFNTDPNHPVFRPPQSPNYGAMSLDQMFGLSRRQSDTGGVGGNTGGINLASTIGNTAGCPSTKRVALIGVVTDCAYTKTFSSKEAAQSDIIQMVNTASTLYENTFNISLGLKNLIVNNNDSCSTTSTATPWNTDCSSGNNITTRLNDFTVWRGEQNDTNAYWTLMSDCATGGEVGVSWLGQLCVHGGNNATVAGANVVVRTSTEWQVFAHESGHTFGAVHDCDSQTCGQGLQKTSQCCPLTSTTCDANGKYIMNPTTSADLENFSQCTIGNICSAIGRSSVQSNCLVDNKGVVTTTGSECGNGIVESGEDCDCGGTQGCGNNNCCDATTCKYKNNAVCDDSNESCCTNCQFSAVNTTCRAASGPCDIAEVCSGTSGDCPADQHKSDGTSCTSGNNTGLACASGQCTSRDLQCRTVLGAVLGSNDTYACDNSACTLYCASSVLPSNECGSMQQNFLDGTPCNGNGHCSNGNCVGSSVGGQIKSWIDDHKSLVIGLAAGLGGLLLLVILSCIISSCRRRRYRKANPPPPPGAYRGGGRGGWAGPIPQGPPRSMQQAPSQPQQAGYGYPPPAYPPPTYGEHVPITQPRYA
ncbi:Metallo-peptidase family M12-domain-containing protein [Talaromyces proteolyticus]|uniref:Disintegrin and metalloproteinase domain-containing protein B n=1 Tax=Talaromyces proteolyticus TaxID=1131652 RepID=A0AAD4KT10_9EURO|nr:Metallo-peptidase family M12-domain-containing protein [Talaromyces proteolyticus]KAH8697662.1 Metallo-peptidase family M12-domain-containing protein [Talaromyces proteolyticus]